MYAELKLKACKQCKLSKDIHFFRFRKPRGTYESYCKACESENNKKWMGRNKALLKKRDFVRNLKSKFGMTENEYYEMRSDQGEGCAICKTPASLSGRALAVDHCHDSKIVRGLLCNECNTAIGLMGEDPKRLMAAISYIKKFKN